MTSEPGQQEQGHTVFVYGTLKKGFPNHYFLKDAEFLGAAATVERYSLYMDEYPFVSNRNAVSPIKGEAYRVGDALLARLDALENCPRLYQRELVPVMLEGGETVEAWLYILPRISGQLIPEGEFRGAGKIC